MVKQNEHQIWESSWWGDCSSTYYEETKQFVYSRLMQLEFQPDNAGPRIDLQGKSVLDIGGGPVSILLKTKNRGNSLIVDPCDYPDWVTARYMTNGDLRLWKVNGEDIMENAEIQNGKVYDEVWIYNVLQHTIDPEKIIQNARKVSKIIRIFEWIDTGTSLGHPHELKEETLNKWLGGIGHVQQLNESYCVGKSYSGIFLGDHYGISSTGA